MREGPRKMMGWCRLRVLREASMAQGRGLEGA